MQIVEVFVNELTLPYLSLATFLTHEYESYLMKVISLFVVTDVVQVLKPVHSLDQLNLNKNESLKSKSLTDVGTHAKLLLEGIADDEKVKASDNCVLKAMSMLLLIYNKICFSTTRSLNMRGTNSLRKEIIPWQKFISQILHSNWPRCLERNHKHI